MNANLPQDELLERYERAKVALPDGLPTGPSAAVRERIMHAAREQAAAIDSIALSAESTPPTGLKSSKNTIEKPMQAQAAANDSFWNIRAFGSLAVMGLAGLLWWQFEHGTPEEQLAAKSAAPSSTASASAPFPVPAALEAAATTSSAVPTPAPAPASVSASVTPRSAALPPSPSPAPAAPIVSNPFPVANAPEKLAQAKMASQSRSKAETAEIATPSTPIAQANVPSPLPASQADRAPAQEAAATGAMQIPQTDKAFKEVPSRTARPNIAAEPSSQRSLETAQAPSMAAAPPAPAPAARAAAPPVRAAAAAPRAAPAADSAPQAVIASPTLLLSAIETRDAPALQQALSQGASPNARSPNGNTALHQAVTQRWAEGARILLAAGADRNAKDSKGHTALDVALELGYSDMAELLATQK